MPGKGMAERGSPSALQVAQAERLRMWICAVGVSLAPLALLLANDDWFFTTVRAVDAWQYIGYFQFYDNPDFLPGHYKLARLPWILLGFGAFQTFGPFLGAYVLHGLVLIALPGAMFAAVYGAFRNWSVAGIVAVLFGFWASGHGSGGWDYHAGAGMALYLAGVAVAFATLNRPAPPPWRMLLQGAVFAAALHTDIFYANMALGMIVFYLWMRRRQSRAWPQMAREAAWTVAGAVALTLALIGINASVGRDPVFFGELFGIVARYGLDPKLVAGYWQPWGEWLPDARYLAIPAAIMTAVIPFGVKSWLNAKNLSAERTAWAIGLIAQAAFLWALWIFWQSLGQTTLNWTYFAYPIAGNTFLALAAWMASNGKAGAPQSFLLPAFAATAAFLALATGFGGILREFFGVVFVLVQSTTILVPFTVMLLALAAGGLAGWGRAGAVVLAIGFAVANFAQSSPAIYSFSTPCRNAARAFDVATQASQFLHRLDSNFELARIWYATGERTITEDGCAVDADYLARTVVFQGREGLTDPWIWPPTIEAMPAEVLAGAGMVGQIVVAITNEPATLAAMHARIQSIGRSATPIESGRFTSNGLELNLHAFRISPPPPDPDRRDGTRLAAYQGAELAATWKVTAFSGGTLRRLYAYFGRGPLQVFDPAADPTRFRPGTKYDHVTLPLIPLPPKTEKTKTGMPRQVRFLVACGPQPGGGRPPSLIVQDQKHQSMGYLMCDPQPGGVANTVIEFGHDVESLRVVATGRKDQSYTLPSRIELFDLDPVQN